MNRSEIEAALVGAVVTWPESIDEVPPGLEPDDFGEPCWRRAWTVIAKRRAEGLPVDSASVRARLDDTEREKLKQAAFLVGSSAYVSAHGQQILQSSAAARLKTKLLELEADDFEALATQATQAIAEAEDRVGASGGDEEYVSSGDLASRVLQGADRAMRGEGLGHKTGIKAIDRVTGGIREGTLWIVGARPSMGKSILLGQIADHVAVSGARAVFVSAEMTVVEIGKREVAAYSGINPLRISEGQLSNDDWVKLTAAGRELDNRRGDRLAYTDSLGSDIGAILGGLRRLRRAGRLDVAVVDYIQQLHARSIVGPRVNRNQELELIARMLADFSRETGAAVVMASQLKRADNVRPTMDHLRDSGAIEAAADVVLLLHREEEESLEREIIVGKNRQGPLSACYQVLDPNRMRFRAMTQQQEPART